MSIQGSEVVCFIPHKSPYQRLSQRMLDISGDRGVLKDVIREGAGELVTPDASVLGMFGGRAQVPSALGGWRCPRAGFQGVSEETHYPLCETAVNRGSGRPSAQLLNHTAKGQASKR